MRAVDLAVFADDLAGEAAAAAARVERARARLRRAALEHEAAQQLPPEAVRLLRPLGLFAPPAADDLLDEIAEARRLSAALGALQAWVERELAVRAPGGTAPARELRPPAPRPRASPPRGP